MYRPKLLGVLGGVALGLWAVRHYQIRLEVRRGSSVELRQAMVRRTAHDLRNPLTTIRARGEMLAKKLSDQPGELRHVEGILRAVGKLDELIGDLGHRLG